MDWTTLTQYQTCQCCGQPLAGFVQTYPAKYNLAARVVVTCWNAECDMEGMTHTPEHHQDECTKLAVKS